MFSQEKRLVLALSLMMFLSFAAFAPSFVTPISLGVQGVPTPGTISTYAENFTSTTYLDAGGTTADGWGNGTLTSTRSISGNQLSFIPSTTPIRSISVQGRKMYLGNYSTSGSHSISLYNITDPTSPEFFDDRGASSYVTQVIVVGDVMYVGTGNLGGNPWLGVYNVTNPYSVPGPIDAIWLNTGEISDLEVQGHYLYVVANDATGNNEWVVFDVQDPTNLVRMGGLGWGELYGFCIDGHVGYFADGTLGLYVRNVSAPGATIGIDSFNTPGNCTDVIVDGNIAYVADGPAGVLIFDVTDPSNLQVLSTYDTSGFARRLALQGKTLFVADGAGGVVVLDVSDPTHPSHVNVFTTPYAWDIDLYAGDIVVGTDNGIILIRYGGGIDLLSHYASFNPGFEFWDVRVQGDIAYIAAGPDGFITVDVSDPGNPVVLDQYTSGITHARKLDVQGHIVAVLETNRFHLFDIRDPTNIKEYASLIFGGGRDVFLWGELCFYSWGGGSGGFGYYNISNPYSPVFTQTSVGLNVTAIWVQGYHIYLVEDLDGSGLGFHIYDLTQLNSPSLVRSYSLSSYQYDIFVDGDFAYCANEDWLSIRNVTNPFSISYPDTIYDTSNPSLGVWGFGPYVLSARGSGGVRLIDAQNVNNVNILTTYAAATQALQITVHGDFVYAANRNTLEIFRLFRGAGACYATGTSIAQSTVVDATTEIIYSATLTQTANIPGGTGISWQLSADGGTNWEPVTPGVPHAFTHQGSDLRYRATFNSNRQDLSAHLYNISISYEHTQPPSAPVLDDPGTDSSPGDITITWSASSDPDGTIDHYELQSSNAAGFAVVLATYTTSALTYNISAPTSGLFYFRVRAVDDDGVHGPWSNVEDINIVGGLPPPPPIPGFPIETIILGAIAALSFAAFYRRRKR
ncbi:MAG: hypothetical protein ACFFDU_06770 [Candidatus Thorarchaeota archaeon]